MNWGWQTQAPCYFLPKKVSNYSEMHTIKYLKKHCLCCSSYDTEYHGQYCCIAALFNKSKKKWPKCTKHTVSCWRSVILTIIAYDLRDAENTGVNGEFDNEKGINCEAQNFVETATHSHVEKSFWERERCRAHHFDTLRSATTSADARHDLVEDTVAACTASDILQENIHLWSSIVNKEQRRPNLRVASVRPTYSFVCLSCIWRLTCRRS